LKITGVHLKEDGKPRTTKFNKWMNVVKPLYERMKKKEKLINEQIAKMNKTKAPRINLTPLNKYLSS